MLESYSPLQPDHYEDHSQTLDLGYLIQVLKRRYLYFALPFGLIAMLGSALTAIQRPIYHAEARIIVESPEISPELVRPTIKELGEERFEVLKQRILAKDNLMATINKYDLFPRARKAMSSSELLDLMRTRVEIKPMPLEMHPTNPYSSTVEFYLAFNYETPDLALKVTHEFLTEILNEDIDRRTSGASETTKILEQDVKKLQGEHDALLAKIEARKLPSQDQPVSEEVKAQTKSLGELEAELIQKSSIYSEEHPAIKTLRKKIAALKSVIVKAPRSASSDNADVVTKGFEQQQVSLERNVEDANRKLDLARIGENMEKNQQAEHLRVVQYPEMPHKPAKPRKLLWLAATLGLAGMVGLGWVIAAELFDDSIRKASELGSVIDQRLIVNIPYLSTPREERRKRRNFVFIGIVLIAVLAAPLVGFSVGNMLFSFPWLGYNLMHP